MTSAGGQISVMPCSRVWTPMNQSISARSSAAPAPRYTGNPDPVILAPAARSSMPSASPISQCGRRVHGPAPSGPPPPVSSCGAGSPQVRTITLASSPPTGTPGSAGFGMRSSASSSSASTAASSTSIAAIRWPASVDDRRSASTSGPCGDAPERIASPIRFEAAFRSARRVSPSPSRPRRRASSSSATSTTAGSSPLSMAPWRTRSASSRRRCRPMLMPSPPLPGRGHRPPVRGPTRPPAAGARR